MEFGRDQFDFYLDYYESEGYTENFPKEDFITTVHHNPEFDEVV